MSNNLYITEFDELVITDNGIPPFGKFAGDTKLQTVGFGDTSAHNGEHVVGREGP
jgi:hypothetical protein